ncbi:unnamed protein product (macronuclear) [Paramecium tetraurelia]|uniref:Aquaporin n=1 Tax=Paramecium tetraurelia TaxID=5888 RepID=A0BVB5_PARTE|nr:uncharacterized protein GSPATT00005728001 [Paramecium tetraurelia]CAK62482.1 unnamed protein product [Paramecium tetraurelia]|eukprot:XP_001429880.1 hypothetical protein (macronuclear) [Paramecium tetraurelia strain d4-2]
MEEQQRQNYSDLVNQEIQQNKPIKWDADNMPQTKVGIMKKEALYIFWFEFIGTFMLTFSIYASKYICLSNKLSNNPFVFACAYGMLILVAQNQKCTFNPAITTVLSGQDNGLWVSVAISSQFGGAFLASLFGFLCFKNYLNDVPYLAQTNIEAYFAVIFGEIFGSLILCAGFIFQYDDLMGLSSDRLEHSIIISALYCVGRTLSYVAKSSLNPSYRIRVSDILQMTSLVLFECCKDGHWVRFWNLWIYSVLPFFGAFFSLALIRAIYRDCYEQQLQAGLRQ